jgi:hypothetical protein
MKQLLWIGILIIAAGFEAAGANRKVTITFVPQENKPEWVTAAEEYNVIWTAEADHVIDGLERVSHLRFPEDKVKAEIYEGASFSGGGNRPMLLRASYPMEIKKATLVHELGHRMNAQLRKRPADLDEHRLLFLYLYDVWTDLYGQEFADRNVAVERTRKGLYDYDTAWTWTLAMTKEQRLGRFAAVVKANGK